MKIRILSSFLLVLIIMSILTSCIDVDADIDSAVEEIEKSRQTIEQQSDAWRSELPILYDNLVVLESQVSSDAKEIIAIAKNQVSDLLEQSKNIASIVAADTIVRTGIEFRCNASFIKEAVAGQLQYLIDDLKFWDENKQHLDQKPVHKICHVNPDTIRLYPSGGIYQIDTSNMKEQNIVQLFGYNFRSDAMPSEIGLYNADNQLIQGIRLKVDYITQYQINLNFSTTDWTGVAPGASIVIDWPDKAEPSNISLALTAPAKVKIVNVIADPAMPIAVIAGSRKDVVRFRITIANEGGMASDDTTIELKSGMENSPVESVFLDSIQPGVTVEKTMGNFIYPKKGIYSVVISLKNGEAAPFDLNLRVYDGFYCEVFSPSITTMWGAFLNSPLLRPICPFFLQGDKVEIFDAGGCVNVGGEGQTSKHFVSPLDANGNPDNSYYGMIAIPGSGILEKSQNISIKYFIDQIKSVVITSQTAVFSIGYKDDYCGDNSYVLVDSGYKDQCQNQGPAYVILRVTRLK